ncbi:MAG: rhodanese-like domain-containing protein, partial [Pseudomonadota bacterium]
MTFELTTLRDLSSAAFDTIIDVRAPSEFALDHVPGAMNLPVLSDAERAEVGTLYKQVDKFEARKRGAALVARNAADHIDGTLRQRPGGWRPLIYCWRGGQRSESFAAILSRIGWRVEVLSGGYRSYRRRVAAV